MSTIDARRERAGARRIVCVGAGPAGLYLGILTVLRDPTCEFTVFERTPRDAPSGWGVTFPDVLLDALARQDPTTAGRIAASRQIWTDQQVYVGRRPVVHLGGRGFGISRRRLLDILTEAFRATC